MAHFHLYFVVLCSTVEFLQFLKQQVEMWTFTSIEMQKVIEVSIGGKA